VLDVASIVTAGIAGTGKLVREEHERIVWPGDRPVGFLR
jgi:hypothetical protein